jgi:hypothetical protein
MTTSWQQWTTPASPNRIRQQSSMKRCFTPIHENELG